MDLPEEKSKSQVKRELQRLTDLGKQLASLSKAQLARLDLDDSMCEAVKAYQNTSSNVAKKRQLKYLGKQLRELQPEQLEAAIDRVKLSQAAEPKPKTSEPSLSEQWAERLMIEDDAFEQLLQAHPDLDRQHCRQLIRNGRKSDKHRAKLVQFLDLTLH